MDEEIDLTQPKEDVEICPRCGRPMKALWENNGWDGEEGPRMDEIVGYYCTACGYKDY